jgi:hypothetical protein
MTDVLKKSPKKMVKIKDLLQAGFLKPNEEIYMEFRGLHFTARVLPNGTLLGKRGVSRSLSNLTFLSILEDPRYLESYYNWFGIPKDLPFDWDDPEEFRKKGTKHYNMIVGGWHQWKNWNGVSLDEFRKRLEK